MTASRHVIGLDAGGTKTRGLIATEAGKVVASAEGGGANLRTHGELEVEKVLHGVVEALMASAGARPDAVALGIAGAGRPDDDDVLRAVLRRIGFRNRVVVTNDAHVAFIAGSPKRVGLALVCGTGSIAWGRNSSGKIARAGGWGWRLGDEGSGFWIGERALRGVLRGRDGRGPATALEGAMVEEFELETPEDIVRVLYDAEEGYPRHRVALFSRRVADAARAGDALAERILAEAAEELVLAARTVVRRLELTGSAYDVVLSGGTFRALPALERIVSERLAAPGARIAPLVEEPAVGAVTLALEELRA